MTRPGAKCALLIAACAVFATAQTTGTYSFNGYPVFIATDDANIISIASVVVPDALKMTNVTARVKIQYPYVGDLNIYLYSPDGTRVKLLERNCGSLKNVDTTFDDSASPKYADFCPTEAGRGPFRANEPLSNFNSADSSLGIWRLAVENNGSDERVGWIQGLTLTITGTAQLNPTFRSDTVFNSASARSGVIVPGQNITILGVSLGPQDGVTAPTGALPTTLGGVRVTLNGTDIPLSYVSSYRIDGQVPFGISTSGPATVQIQNGSAASKSISVNTQMTFPGIYAYDPMGIGPAKAVNQDGKLNSKATPARRGEIVIVYASGLGAVAPTVAAGQPGPSDPLSMVSSPVAASIGGVPAPVAFAGLAPGQRGVYQVNLMVPMEVPAGTRDVVISNAGNGSQDQVTIEVQ